MDQSLQRRAYDPTSDSDWAMSVSDESASIVGPWKIEVLSKSTTTNTNPLPDSVLIDFGMVAWHSDGTELLNSGSRNPADADLCQGVWAKVGPSTYALNHMALGWTGGSYTGPAVIRERVTVDGTGRHCSGTFKLTQYLTSAGAHRRSGHSLPASSIKPDCSNAAR